MKTIDVNCDMGESAEAVRGGLQESLLPWITSVNVACGGHAGDEGLMRETIAGALRWKVSVGAHPSYPDRANFGRVRMRMTGEEIARSVAGQIRELARIAEELKIELRHVKAHGALYNDAAADPATAEAIAAGAALFSRDLVLVGPAGSRMLQVFASRGFRTAAEAFADRRYEPDGSLRSRSFPDALVSEPGAAAAQALAFARGGEVRTLCVHSDTPGALAIVRAVAGALDAAGIERRAFFNETP
ncbi:MAG: 5-oxoprolinase subunit PxpA [Elusimicrobiota bacterium]